MKINWEEFDREEVAFGLLEAAARAVDERAWLPIAVTLARAGGQHFSDQLVSRGDSSALAMVGKQTERMYGPSRGWKWLKGIVLDRSNAIKHRNRADEPMAVSLAYEIVIMQIFCAIGDAMKVTGKTSPALLEFRARHAADVLARLSETPSNRPYLDAMPAAWKELSDWSQHDASSLVEALPPASASRRP